jgi:hypothetical protein
MIKPISKILALLIVILLIQSNSTAIAQNMIDNNGWELFTWKTKKNDVEKVLNQKGIEPESYNFSKPTSYALIFKYGDLKTDCRFDAEKELVKVSQHIDFSVAQDKKSKEYFDKLMEEMEIKYGRAENKSNNLIDEVITVNWKLTFTKIHLVYDYKYKIVDEMGCCSYTIDIDFEPVE